MRVVLSALVVSFFLLAPLSAQAEATPSYNAHCKRITNQIDRYEDVADMARDRGDEMWLDGTLAHIDRLEGRRDRLCPAYAEGVAALATAKFWKDTYALTKQLAKGAAQYFTFGMY
jgi:hypothetical protein